MKRISFMLLSIILTSSVDHIFCQTIRINPVKCSFTVNNELNSYYLTTYNTACNNAVNLTKSNNLSIDYFDVIYGINDNPLSCLYEFVYYKGYMAYYLTLKISLSPGYALENYYFSQSVEKKWKESLEVSAEKRIVVCNSGTYLQKNGNEFIKYPENKIFDKKSVSENSISDSGVFQDSIRKASSISTADNGSAKGSENVQATEVVIPGVPNYLWYMNCGLISNTMILGYWNDKGYNNFIPGGTSTTGHYWAVTEELCNIGESPDFNNIDNIRYYTNAKEYGNNAMFDFSNFKRTSFDKNKFWDKYVRVIDSTLNPVMVVWMGPPYGPHATVGIGYRIDGEERFLVLNDTWTDVASYVNYDVYYESIVAFTHYFPAGNKSSGENITKAVQNKSVTLQPLDLEISPSLNPDMYAYHSFELADLNGDKLEDLIICNFRIFTKGLSIYYNNGTSFIEDGSFYPELEQFECPGISRTFDFDKDGDLDIAVTGYWSAVNIFVNNNGRINVKPIVVDNKGRGFIDLECSDFDLDGDVDLISTSVDGQIRLYRNQDGNFTDYQIIDLGSQSYKVKSVDINKDNFPDIVASYRSGTVVVFKNNNGTFNTTPDFKPSGHGGLSFDVADLNIDGWPDIVSSSDGKIIIYQNNSGDFTDQPLHVNDNLDCFPKDITATDLNNDFFPELIISSFNRNNIILENNSGEYDPVPVWKSADVNPTINVRVFDNNKNERRLLFGISRGGTLEFYKVDLEPVLLTATPANRNVVPEAGNTTFTINSNTSWTITDDASWLTLSPTTGTGNGTLTVSFEANATNNPRTATITITGTGTSVKTVTVTQAFIKTLSVSPSGKDADPEAGNTSFTIASNTSWTISNDAAWLTVSPTSGTGNATVTVTFEENTSDNPRTGILTISGIGVSPQLFTVNQSVPTIIDNITDTNFLIYPNPTRGLLTIKFPESITGDITIYISDASGRLIKVIMFSIDNSEEENYINLTTLNRGLYFIAIKNRNSIRTFKILRE